MPTPECKESQCLASKILQVCDSDHDNQVDFDKFYRRRRAGMVYSLSRVGCSAFAVRLELQQPDLFGLFGELALA